MQHIRSGESQSMQIPVSTHGVLRLMLMARTGPATSLNPIKRGFQIRNDLVPSQRLLLTCGGPKVMELVRLPEASLFTISPVIVTALAEDRNRSAVICSFTALEFLGSARLYLPIVVNGFSRGFQKFQHAERSNCFGSSYSYCLAVLCFTWL